MHTSLNACLAHIEQASNTGGDRPLRIMRALVDTVRTRDGGEEGKYGGREGEGDDEGKVAGWGKVRNDAARSVRHFSYQRTALAA